MVTRCNSNSSSSSRSSNSLAASRRHPLGHTTPLPRAFQWPEQHTQFLTGPADSYGPPPSGNDLDYDHAGYASQKNSVAALPDGTDPQQLPGLDGLNVISAQKSQSIQLGNGQQPQQNFQVQFGGSLSQGGNGNGNGPQGNAGGEQSANHEEILSQGLLQSILTAIEQPQNQNQNQQQSSLPQNHKAQSRSDLDHDQEQDEAEDAMDVDGEEHEHQGTSASNRVEVRVLPDADAQEEEVPAEVKEIEPIVAADLPEEEAKH
ncbi:GL20423 [Drosophila persimilis]|uniref:GL20423 n=1 Tax=Drosophila persimilis TaxID=7234 RepID=B4GY61_DROPE|nr:GL20423 [Drosophila persimilis]